MIKKVYNSDGILFTISTPSKNEVIIEGDGKTVNYIVTKFDGSNIHYRRDAKGIYIGSTRSLDEILDKTATAYKLHDSFLLINFANAYLKNNFETIDKHNKKAKELIEIVTMQNETNDLLFKSKISEYKPEVEKYEPKVEIKIKKDTILKTEEPKAEIRIKKDLSVSKTDEAKPKIEIRAKNAANKTEIKTKDKVTKTIDEIVYKGLSPRI